MNSDLEFLETNSEWMDFGKMNLGLIPTTNDNSDPYSCPKIFRERERTRIWDSSK